MHGRTMTPCPRCGAGRKSRWLFCPKCGEDLTAGSDAVRTVRPSPILGLSVFSVLVLIGVGTWMQIRAPKTRSGPPGSPSVAASVEGAGSEGGDGQLPEGHPPLNELVIPDDIKTFIAELAEKAAASPEDLATWQRLAQVQSRAAQVDPSYYAPALEALRHVLELEPKDPEALRGVAGVHYDLTQYAQSVPYFEQYLALRPDDAGARTDLATVRLHLGEVERAVAEYRAIIAADPSFVQARYNLGVALHREGKTEEALDEFQKARGLTSDPRIQARLDQIIGQLDPQAVAAAAASAPAAAGGTGGSPDATPRTPYQAAVERFFRTHEIVGPKLVAIEWPSDTRARVLVRDFPMAAMPPFARTKFTSRIEEALRDAKQSGGVRDTTEVAIVDAATGAVMDTVAQ
jgi:tetratricopeptide (TPR) repeat protein